MSTYYPAKSVYFLTGSTFLHYPYFKNIEDRHIVLDQIKKLKREKGIQICAYSIAMNHYHMMFYTRRDNEVALVKQYMHGGTSAHYRKIHKRTPAQMWGTMKTIRVYSNEMYWKIVGYICGNLLKHREVGTFEDLSQRPFSSYGYFARKYSDDFMREVVYKVIDVGEDAEGNLDFEGIEKCRLRVLPN